MSYDAYETSSAQKRLYMINHLQGNSILYNEIRVWIIHGKLEPGRFKKAVERFSDRHETLRTAFVMKDGEVLQKVYSHIQCDFKYTQREIENTEPAPEDIETIINSFLKPYDLAKAPLWKIELVGLNRNRQLLLFDFHHIIADGTSMDLVIKELEALYMGTEIPQPEIQYVDFAAWQNEAFQDTRIKKQEAYWLKVFEHHVPVLDLPTDFPRPQGVDIAGTSIDFRMDDALTARVSKLVLQFRTSLYVVLLTVFNILLAKYSNQEDIVIGTPISGRIHREFENIIGMFVNTLAMRNWPKMCKTFGKFLTEVSQNVFNAFENQDYQFEMLVEKVAPERELNRNPLFDVMFALQNYSKNIRLSASGNNELLVLPFRFKSRVSKFDLTLQAFEVDYSILFRLDYRTSLFRRETIEQLTGHFLNIFREVTENPDVSLSEIRMISDSEKEQLLYVLNGTDVDYLTDKTIHEMFEEQVERTPDRIAVVAPGGKVRVTYRDLNERVNRLAHWLNKKGVAADTVVALMMERSIEMVAAVLGILKAGGAYLPIDTDFPEKRILAILEESSVSYLLTRENVTGALFFTALQNIRTEIVEPVLTPPRASVRDFDSLPAPDRTLVNYEKYHQNIGIAMARHTVSLQATRGCPYNCAYCHKIWPKKHVARSAENIFEEIQKIHDAGVKRFVFIDDIFNLDIRNSTRLLEMIVRKLPRVQLFFPNGLRGDILTEDFIDLMVEAGTVNIDLALESASPRIQKLIGKNLNLEKFHRNVQYITQRYPQLLLEMELMIGFPTETEEEALITFDFLRSLHWVHFPNLNILKIYPNTDMCRLALDNGITMESIESSVNLAYHELPDTLPFSRSFTRLYQTRFMNEYMQSKERLLHLLPHHVRTLSRVELIEKYNSYYPQEIRNFSDILQLGGISAEEFGEVEWVPDGAMAALDFVKSIRPSFPTAAETGCALRVLLLDLSQFFSRDSKDMLYDMVEEPLGLMYLLTYLNRAFGDRVWGKIAKSRLDFDSFDVLKQLIFDFRPDVIGIRTLSYYKEFFHRAIELIRGWGVEVPIIAGGPYATSDYRQMLQDSNITLAVLGEGELTTAHLVEKMIANGNRFPTEDALMNIPGLAFIKEEDRDMLSLRKRQILFLDHSSEVLANQPTENPKNITHPNHLLYLISTSGSTGKPKSVMLEHRNLVNLLHFQFSDTTVEYDKVLQFASIGFDVSAQEIFSTLLYGGELYLIDRDMRHDFTALFRYIGDNDIHVLYLPPAFLKLVFEEEEYTELFPKGIKHIIAAGEQLIVSERFRRYLTTNSVYLHNHYGPSETHVVTTLKMAPADVKPEKPSIGLPIPNNRILILDEHLNLKPVGVVGEIYISGANVGRGYYQREELTSEKFLPNPYIEGERMYRTGDLGRWLAGHEIQFLGRKDYQVKVRGFRVELEEIEKHLVKIDFIKEAVVLINEIENGEKYLSAYLVCEEGEGGEEDLSELRELLSRSLPIYMIPSYFKKIDRIPLSANGKVDRNALRNFELGGGTGKYAAPVNQVEEELVNLWSDVLRKAKASIGVEDNFFDLGGHSLNGTVLLSRIHKRYQVRVPLMVLFQRPTVRGLAEYISAGQGPKSIYEAIEPAVKMEYYPQSSAQKRLFFLDQFENIGVTYNLPDVLRLKKGVEVSRMEMAFRKLIQRHESLRTSFKMVDNQSVQIIHQEVDFQIEYGDINDFVRPFDLSHAPLLRVGFAQRGEDILLLVDMHHIITDGTSIEILRRDFLALYERKELEPLKLQYKDFAWWQNSRKVKKLISGQEVYWLKVFEGEIPVLDIPADYARPSVQSFAGSRIDVVLDSAVTRSLNSLAKKYDATLYMVLLAVYNVFLHKLSRQEDIVVGTPIAARRHPDLENIIGMFVNTLALRNYPRAEIRFSEFLSDLRNSTLEAYENQEYQFEDLVDRLSINLNRDVSRNPLFDVVFALHNQEERLLHVPGAAQFSDSILHEFDLNIIKFDLEFHGVEIGDQLFIGLHFCTKLYKKETVQRFFQYFKRIIESVINNPGQKLSEIDIVSGQERRQLLYDFNNVQTDYPHDRTIHSLLEEQAARIPDRIAVVGHAGQHLTNRTYWTYMTYKELNEKSNQLGHVLRKKGAAPDDFIGIMVDRFVEMFIAVLAILKAGAAYLPIDPDYPDERKKYMLKEASAPLLITEETYAQQMDGETTTEIITIENPEIFKGPANNPDMVNKSDDSIYIIYTSGSTGTPKGVVVVHRNVVRLVKNTNFVQFREGERLLQTGALEFDASTFEIWGSLLNGMTLCLVPKDDILNPGKLKEHIRTYDIATIWLTSPLFNQLSGVDVEIFAGLRNLLVGGDVLSPLHINRVRQRYPALNIINGYGPTENTTFSTTFLIHKEYNQRIPIGRPISNSTAYVVDRYDRLVPVGVIGELLVGGDGVSRGYLNNPELTAEKFVEFHKSYRTYTSYRTGDLVRWLSDGTIDFLGRIDQQVKIRGFRIELEEIESCLLKHELIKEAVVIDWEEDNGEKYLCGYIVSNQDVEVAELKAYLSGRLPDYMIPSYFVQLEVIPLTPNGKVDRRALPMPEVGVGEAYAAPDNEIEKQLVTLWSGVLNIEKDKISVDADFFHLGGHSLKATLLAARIHQLFDVKMPLTEIFLSPTVRELAQYVKAAAEDKYAAVESVEKKEYYVLSSAQKRLYILQEMEPTSIVYNMPQMIGLNMELNKEKLEEIFKQLIARHESLRTSFIVVNEEPVQKIHRDVVFELEYHVAWSMEHRTWERDSHYAPCSIPPANFVRPFDLSQVPLLRVGLIKVEAMKYILMVDMHHIISDGFSQGILVKEFMTVYQDEGVSLPPLRLQYKDYAEWQNSDIHRQSLKQQEQYWLKQLAGELPVLHLPYDYPRPDVQSFEGSHIRFSISVEETSGLKALAADRDTTLYMLLLAAFYLLLTRLSGQEDIIVGSPVAGRRHVDFQSIIGMFVNTLTMRNKPEGMKPFNGFLAEVKKMALEAFENQDYQFEDLVEEVSVVRDIGRNPVFDVMFTLQNLSQQGAREFLSYDYESEIAKFDLMLDVLETSDSIVFSFEYCTKLFKEDTIERFITYFKTIVSSIVENPYQRISVIEMLPEEEKRRLLVDFNDTAAAYPKDKTIHQLFEEQVECTPDHIALVGSPGQLLNYRTYRTYMTYKKLNETSNQLAHLLIAKGVEPNSIVGIMAERSLEMVTGIFGILKAGGAYLPIDPNYPRERIRYLLNDSGAGVLVSEVSEVNEEIEVIDLIKIIGPIGPIGSIIHGLPNQPCYIIYTSGSTGRPKGVIIEHRSVVNVLSGLFREYPFGETATYLLKTSYTFDVSVSELFGWFWGGGRLVLLEPGGEKDPQIIIDTIARFHVTHINFVPSMFHVLVEALVPQNIKRILGLKYIFLAGEALPPHMVDKFRQLNTNIPLENLYGPTEGTVYASGYSLSQWRGGTSVPIGKPVQNEALYILDKYDHLQPIGVPGELCISGEGVARGYLNRPELTAERFIGFHRFDRAHIFYRTGDLARWLPDGPTAGGAYILEFLGRIDQQVKIRGFRVELGEIESRLLEHDLVKEAVVMARKEENEQLYLCGYIVAREDFDLLELGKYLSKTLPAYMIPSHFMRLESVPLTTSGKVNRRVLPRPKVQVGKEYIAPSNRIEEQLTTLWSEVLYLEKDKISVDANFFQLGGHSLKVTILAVKIHKVFAVKIPLIQIFKNPTIRKLAGYIKSAAKVKYAAIESVEKREYYMLSAAQKRLYILQQMAPGLTVYNMPQVEQLDTAVDKETLVQTFNRLIRRHESLRTSFLVINEEPVQKIHEKGDYKLEITNYKIIEDFIHPFDLSVAPLLRVGLIKMEKEKYLLLVDMHHIISDGFSQAILVKEFMAIHQGISLPPLRLQYKDYAHWQNMETRQEILKQQEQYWLDRLAGELPMLNLPYDYPRPDIQSFEGRQKAFFMFQEVTAALKALTVGEEATLYMVILAAFNLLLAQLSGQEDIIIGSPVAGRPHADLQSIMGMFVNTLVMRNYPAGEKTFISSLQEIKESALEAFENQEYQFEDLVEKISVVRDPGRNPVFDVMFAFQNLEDMKEQKTDNVRSYEYESRIAKFDVTLVATERNDTISFSLEYCTRLFKEETIDRFIIYFKNIVSSILENPHQKICNIEMLKEEEKRHILLDFNDTGEPYPHDITIQQLFEEQVERTPDNIALIGSVGQHLTYRTNMTYKKLNQTSNQLAHHLVERGVKKNEMVGLKSDRSLEMIIGILGILKAGGAYIPLNPKAPAARSTFILKECRARILVSKGREMSENIEVIDLIKIRPIGPIGSIGSIVHEKSPTHLCYVIFTSGSTGKPKGVPITHANLCPLLHWGYRNLGLGTKDRFIQNLSYYFDWSAWEIMMAITTGAGLYMVPDDLLLNPEACIPFMNRHKITVLHITPTQYQYFLNVGRKLETLKYLFLGAERLSRELVERSFESVNEDCRVFNMYGPTECTIISAVLEIERSDVEKFENLSSVPIGVPVANIDLLVLDKYLNPCPVNVLGELYIGGDCVAHGYLNNPELTIEKFFSSSLLCFFASSLPRFPLYRTGDLVRWLRDGTIEFLGRVDFQVKIRGFRIELGEIESHLLTHDLVKEAVVIDRETQEGEKYLCGYIIPKKEFDLLELKEYLSKSLPDYMIPSYFIPIERIPLNPNGKLDHRALPAPEGEAGGGKDYAAPANEIEEKLTIIWSEVLGIEKEKISVDTDFFSLGGHSLNATVLTSKIEKTFHTSVPLVEVFTSPTIRRLAGYIDTRKVRKHFPGDERVVLLRETRVEAGKEACHVFLIHDGTGEVEGYTSFCQYLKEPLNCWGIRAEREWFQQVGPQTLTIETLARQYIGAMKKVQAEGPYCLVGWSLGGTIAYEIVRLLEESGEAVGYLLLIDSPPPQKNTVDAEFEAEFEFTRQSEMTWLSGYITDKAVKEEIEKQPDIKTIWSTVLNYLEESDFDQEVIKGAIPGNLVRVIPNVDQLSIRQLVTYLNVIRSLDKARAVYLPPAKIKAPVYYVGASESTWVKKEEWNQYTEAPVRFYQITGDHFSILRMPQLKRFAWVFKNLDTE